MYNLCNVHGKWTRLKLVQKLIIFIPYCTLRRSYTFYIYKKEREIEREIEINREKSRFSEHSIFHNVFSIILGITVRSLFLGSYHEL